MIWELFTLLFSFLVLVLLFRLCLGVWALTEMIKSANVALGKFDGAGLEITDKRYEKTGEVVAKTELVIFRRKDD